MLALMLTLAVSRTPALSSTATAASKATVSGAASSAVTGAALMFRAISASTRRVFREAA